jgi:hypothetical protein
VIAVQPRRLQLPRLLSCVRVPVSRLPRMRTCRP